MTENRKTLNDTALSDLSGGTENGKSEFPNTPRKNILIPSDNGKQVPGGNEDVLDPKRKSIID